MKYLIKRTNKSNDIICFKCNLKGYTFSPNGNRLSFLSIRKIEIINSLMIENILTIKFDKLYKELAYKIYLLLTDDESDNGNCDLVLDECAKFRSILLHKYQNFLSKEKEKKYLDRIRVLENEVREKKFLIDEYVDEKKQSAKYR